MVHIFVEFHQIDLVRIYLCVGYPQKKFLEEFGGMKQTFVSYLFYIPM